MTLVPRSISDLRIVKSHELITAEYDEMTLKESQLLALAVSLIPNNIPLDKIDEPITVPIERQMLDRTFGANKMGFGRLRELCELLQTRAIVVHQRISEEESAELDLLGDPLPTRRQELTSWKRMIIVPICAYEDGTFKITLNHGLNRHFLNLRERMGSHLLTDLTELNTFYAMRFYELMTMIDHGGDALVDINRLRGMIGCRDKYQQYRDFRRYIIEPAIALINKHSDIEVSFNAHKTQRFITHVQFMVKRKLETIQMQHPELFSRLVAMLIAERLNEKRAHELVSALISSGKPPETLEETLSDNIEVAKAYSAKLEREGREANYLGILTSAVQGGWKKDKATKPKPRAVPRTISSAVVENPEELAKLAKQARVLLADDLKPFNNYLKRVKDWVSQSFLEKEGIESSKLDRALSEYAKIKAGRR